MYISYSSAVVFKDCPFKFKLQYVDKVPFDRGSLHTAFGDAVHLTNKMILIDNIKNTEEVFNKNFKKSLKELPDAIKREILTDKELKKTAKDMFQKGAGLCEESIRALHKQFPGFKIIAAEGKVIEPIIGYMKGDYEFKGILDLVIQTPDEMIHVIDWKTTSWGWAAEKISDTWTTYQLTYYKHFLSQQGDVEVDKINTHFGLMKRTAKDQNDRIEFIETKVGKKKISNALKVLNDMVYNVDHKRFPKNRLSCDRCVFRKTKWCP